MQLPDFISKMLGFAEKAEKHFVAAELLTAANTRIAALESELATLKASSADGAVQIKDLTGKFESAQTALAAKDTELKNVQAQLVAAQGKANAVIASQGLAADQLPPLEPRADGKPNPKTLTLTEQCLAAAKAGTAARN
jgi:hypothetical protein